MNIPALRPAQRRRAAAAARRGRRRAATPTPKPARSGSRRSGSSSARPWTTTRSSPRPAAGKAAAPAPDPRLAALVPYARGEKPVIFRAEHRIEILDALKLADELKLKAVISGGAEAWKVADALKAAKVPVLVGGHAPAPDRARPTPTTPPTPTRPGSTRRA